MPGLPVPLATGATAAPQLTLAASATTTASLRLAASKYAAVLFARPGLRGYWALNEASGLTARDVAGATAENGSYAGSGVTYAQTGVVADGSVSARFDGLTGLVDTAGGASEIDVANTFTIVLWAARERTGGEQLLHKGTNGLRIRFSATNLVEVLTAAGIIARSSVAITDTSPHLIGITKSGATTKVYIDGADVTTTVADQTLAATTEPLVIGA